MIACTPPLICSQTPPRIVRPLPVPPCPRGGWTMISGHRVRFVVDCHGAIRALVNCR